MYAYYTDNFFFVNFLILTGVFEKRFNKRIMPTTAIKKYKLVEL